MIVTYLLLAFDSSRRDGGDGGSTERKKGGGRKRGRVEKGAREGVKTRGRAEEGTEGRPLERSSSAADVYRKGTNPSDLKTILYY